KARRYFSGFTGSAGVMVITQNEANLWTDGRYFIQAPKELAGSCVILRKMGEEGVPTVKEYLKQTLKKGDVLAFDGRVLSAKEGTEYEKELGQQGVMLYTKEDLTDSVWACRPEMSCQPVFVLEEKYAGKSVAEKLSDLRKKMEEKSADVHILGALDDIAWLFNIRGGDVANTPVVLAFAAVTMSQAIIFANSKAFSPTVIATLEKSGVTLKPYDEIYDYARSIAMDKKVMLDMARTNYAIMQAVSATVVEAENPEILMKAVKNPVEIENTKRGHINDCVAVTKFMYWLKNNVGKTKITEVSAQNYLEQLRKQQPGYIDLSFTTIAGYKEHAAMMHYSANEETDVELKAEGMLLVDSGGQYYLGTTDITRTFVLGEISDVEKLHFTTLARSVMAVSNLKFLHGCRGVNFDIVAREPLWELGLDYKCGTGHGVGYLLNVHEGPNGFRWKAAPDRNEGAIFEEGMITTIEPGVYIEGSHGIRTENELLCRTGEKNEYGQFMYFEPITFVPIDLDGIVPELMSQKERNWLNDYHKAVYEKIAPFLEPKEQEWLKKYTRAI
ncbi:MAG: aminopeptidase P family protein, partial [Oscillospiraceae bacterium]